MKNDSEYTVYLNDAESESFTVESVVTTVGKQSSMGGGFGNGGSQGENFDPKDFQGGRNGFGEDFQPATDENGDPVMPDGEFHHGGGRGEKPDFN